jgi:Ran GTPase-activating protein (RanGAP) involved in mRNA processing and transport
MRPLALICPPFYGLTTLLRRGGTMDVYRNPDDVIKQVEDEAERHEKQEEVEHELEESPEDEDEDDDEEV